MNTTITQSTSFADFVCYPLSEKAISIQFGNKISEQTLQLISSFHHTLNKNPFPGMIVCVPAYCTLTVFYDPILVAAARNLTGSSSFEKVADYLKHVKEDGSGYSKSETSTIQIPVRYGGEDGPDLDDLARLHHLSVDEVIRLHSSATYFVYMIGFVPGFAYLGGLPEALNTPRKEIPRQRVPAGSVGIAGMQTGIYPMETPGGWQLIGRTSLELFNAAHTQPALLKAGDRVSFYPVER